MKHYLIIIALHIILFSCSTNKQVRVDFYSFEDDVWIDSNKVEFNFKIKNQEDLIVNYTIRHTNNYRYQNIIMFKHHYFNNSLLSLDTLDILLAKEDGKWLGSGSLDIKEFTTSYSNYKKFSNGNHKFIFELAMRDKKTPSIGKLKNISELGIYLTKKDV